MTKRRNTNQNQTALPFVSKLALLLEPTPIVRLSPIGKAITHDFMVLVRNPAKTKTKEIA